MAQGLREPIQRDLTSKELRGIVKKAEVVFNRLKEAIERVKDDLDRDGAIQRFEFTVELL